MERSFRIPYFFSVNRTRVIHIVQWAFRVVLAAVLLIAGIFKLQDNTALFETVAYITWLPTGVRWLIIDLLPWAEIVLALLLLLRRFEFWVLSVTGLVYLGFFIFSIYGTATGMEGDCGCFGDLMDSNFGPGMIIRNGLFLVMAGFLFYRPSD